MMILDLTQLKTGQKGIIVEIQGGTGLINRLESMGIRAGKNVTKISAQLWKGPQTIKLDNLQIAIGFRMARKILLKIEK
ncbi:MAG: ferrous iron transport protein A [Candidatus Omnitrophica bacterium]|nr:ferrous iron transport protein A [Candidatus Omnitrophota bacterium]